MGATFARARPWPGPPPPPPSPKPSPAFPSLLLTPPPPSPTPPPPPSTTLPPPSTTPTPLPPPPPSTTPPLPSTTPILPLRSSSPPSTTPPPPGALLPSAFAQQLASASPTAWGVHPAPRVLGELSPAPLPTPATSPCPCAAPPQQGIDKVFAFLGMALPFALSTLPYLYLVYSGSMEKTRRLFGTPAMLAAMINSILWLLYSITVIKIGQSLSLLILHSFISMRSFGYLMCVYASKKNIAKGYVLGGSFVLCLSVLFVVLEWTQNPSEVVIAVCGVLGLLGLFLCHVIQFINMVDTSTRSEQAVTAVTLFPDCVVNLSTFIITVRRHPEHYIIWASALLGFICNVVEIIVLSIISVGGYFRQPPRITNVEDPRVQTSNVLRGPHAGDDSSAIVSDQDAARTPNMVAGHAPEQNEVVRIVNFIHGSNLENQEDAAYYVIIQQTTRGCEIFTLLHLDLRMRVIIEAIPRIMIQIERDLYIPMLVHASGITETIACLIDQGTNGLKRKRPMEQHEPYKKWRISKG